jgi:hypothetical protein
MKWEYAVKEIGGYWITQEEAEKILDDLGSRGWELVSVVSVADGSGMTKRLLGFFKQPLRNH